jgi:hypothetical protein
LGFFPLAKGFLQGCHLISSGGQDAAAAHCQCRKYVPCRPARAVAALSIFTELKMPREIDGVKKLIERIGEE